MADSKRPAPTSRTGGGSARAKGRASKRADHGHGGPEASTRYTPRNTEVKLPSPTWVPVVMIALFVIGLLVIFLHYVDLVLPGASSNWWLLAGLGFMLGGIITATQYR
jgi:Cell division protein CrgA